jgi:methyl-accepting chemotaxis protein-1 (serine sensor receptor)
MNFQNLTIRVKLQLGFGMLAALVVVVSGIALTQLHRSTESFSNFIDGINARADVANQFRTAVDRRAIAARNLVLVTKASDLELEKADVTNAHADVQAKLKLLMEMTANATDATQQARDLVAEMSRVEALYSPVALDIAKLALSGQHEAAITKLDDECRPLLASLIGTTQAYAQLARDRQQQVIREYQEQYQTQVVMLMSFSAGAVLLSILASWLITRAIVGPIQTAVRVAQTVASGDLTSHFDVDGKDETGDLLRALRGMNDHLLQTVGSVRAISNSRRRRVWSS